MTLTEAQSVIDSLEADLDRMRGLDSALKVSMLARMGQVRTVLRSVGALDRMAENAQELGLMHQTPVDPQQSPVWWSVDHIGVEKI